MQKQQRCTQNPPEIDLETARREALPPVAGEALQQEKVTPAHGPGHAVNLMIGDSELASELAAVLERAGYSVQEHARYADFLDACRCHSSLACIIDMRFVAGDEGAARLEETVESCPPVFFVSSQDGVEARLAAVRAGASRFFCQPLDSARLVHSLDNLAREQDMPPGRILWVTDHGITESEVLSRLRDAGLEVEILERPLAILDTLVEFIPDVTVIDVTGAEPAAGELAWLIRHDDSWAHMAVLVLTGEEQPLPEDVKRAVKPLHGSQLVQSVSVAARRSRRAYELTRELRHALRESQYQLITMDQHDIVSVADVTGRITKVNDRFCEISGYSREELLGQNHRILKSGVHPAGFYEDMWKTISQGRVWRGTICNRKKNGEEYWVESTIVPFLDSRGRPYKYVSARTDVTQLRKNEQRLELGQLYANIGTWDWDIRTGNLYWSDRVAPLFGFMEEIHETDLDSFLELIHEDDREQVTDAINISLGNNVELSCEFRVVWPDGTQRWMLARGDVLRRDDGNPLHMLGIVQDIDLRKRAEQNLIEARDQAEAANRAKSQFLSSMSHELRTPLNAIMGFGQLLRMDADQKLSDNQKDNVDEILKAGKHLLSLINEVLDLARVETGNIELELEAVPLNDILIESLQLIMPLAHARAIEIILLHEDEAIPFSRLSEGGYAVQADATRLKQVMLNLLSNAVKYNRDGGRITVRCSRARDGRIRVSVSDMGPGLSEQQQAKLFVAFERLGAEESGIEGTGIGMMIAKSIVELMGGTIGVESRLNEGSTFWVELAEGRLEKEDKIMKQNGLPPAMDDVAAGRKTRTVLYIEDNPANLRLVDQLLQRRGGIRLLSATEPEAGIEMVRADRPDMVLLDINLPGLDGYEVLDALRKLENGHDLPVVAISANAMPRDIERGREAGFLDYITKPIDVVALLAAVDAGLARNAAA